MTAIATTLRVTPAIRRMSMPAIYHAVRRRVGVGQSAVEPTTRTSCVIEQPVAYCG
jgi:hypothetical protein